MEGIMANQVPTIKNILSKKKDTSVKIICLFRVWAKELRFRIFFGDPCAYGQDRVAARDNA